MARKAIEMQPLQANRLKTLGRHAVGGGAGLALQIAPVGSKSWMLRVMLGGKRREMGLGGFTDVTLSDAREAARAARNKIKLGIDPINGARSSRSELAASRAKDVTFQRCALLFIEAHEASWSPRSHAQWLSSLEKYAFPVIGQLIVRDVKLANVLAVLPTVSQERWSSPMHLELTPFRGHLMVLTGGVRSVQTPPPAPTTSESSGCMTAATFTLKTAC